MSGKVNVSVVYCGGSGYASRFYKLKAALDRDFGDVVVVTGNTTPNITGYFEVSVNKKLIHSKKNGDGYVDTPALQKIQETIRAA